MPNQAILWPEVWAWHYMIWWNVFLIEEWIQARPYRIGAGAAAPQQTWFSYVLTFTYWLITGLLCYCSLVSQAWPSNPSTDHFQYAYTCVSYWKASVLGWLDLACKTVGMHTITWPVWYMCIWPSRHLMYALRVDTRWADPSWRYMISSSSSSASCDDNEPPDEPVRSSVWFSVCTRMHLITLKSTKNFLGGAFPQSS